MKYVFIVGIILVVAAIIAAKLKKLPPNLDTAPKPFSPSPSFGSPQVEPDPNAAIVDTAKGAAGFNQPQ